jgi:hypothetical protein
MSELLRGLLQPEHRFAQANLSAYLDSKLRGREKSRVERHLQSCAECRQDLATLRQTIDLLHLVPEVPLPRSFLVSAEASRVSVRQPATAFFAMRAVSAIATMLLVLVFSGNLLLSSVFAPATASQPLKAAAPVSRTLVVEAAAPVQPTVAAARQAAPSVEPAAAVVALATPQPTANLGERAVTAMKAPSAATPGVAAPGALAAASATPASDAPPALPVTAGVSAPVVASSAVVSPTAAPSGAGAGEKVAAEKSQAEADSSSSSPASSRDNGVTDTSGAP